MMSHYDSCREESSARPGLTLLELSKEEADDIYWALSCRLGLIETGDPSVRAVDIAAGYPGKLRPLSTDQMKIIIRAEELMKKVQGVR